MASLKKPWYLNYPDYPSLSINLKKIYIDMEKITLYNKTVDILVQAYFNDTLVHHNCYACAVGNLIAANNKYSFTKCMDLTAMKIVWDIAQGKYYSPVSNWYDYPHSMAGTKELLTTGYSVEECLRIEKSFEGASSIGDYMFNGLMAVIDVLDIIHNNTDTSATETTKQRFTKRTLVTS